MKFACCDSFLEILEQHTTLTPDEHLNNLIQDLSANHLDIYNTLIDNLKLLIKRTHRSISSRVTRYGICLKENFGDLPLEHKQFLQELLRHRLCQCNNVPMTTKAVHFNDEPSPDTEDEFALTRIGKRIKDQLCLQFSIEDYTSMKQSGEVALIEARNILFTCDISSITTHVAGLTDYDILRPNSPTADDMLAILGDTTPSIATQASMEPQSHANDANSASTANNANNDDNFKAYIVRYPTNDSFNNLGFCDNACLGSLAPIFVEAFSNDSLGSWTETENPPDVLPLPSVIAFECTNEQEQHIDHACNANNFAETILQNYADAIADDTTIESQHNPNNTCYVKNLAQVELKVAPQPLPQADAQFLSHTSPTSTKTLLRMQELESIRHLLPDSEYKSKRKAILDTI